eukprot:TRINITY_DN4304_c0_g1_i2.p1 TRINITY_DN4304_c0_g1~~TRINITY_DN4304_c0_g1_i2.p1  ORF type:complete len:617 (-),score=80.13 TRINITY_DN4304_c0_g1_i2:38-1888(-)
MEAGQVARPSQGLLVQGRRPWYSPMPWFKRGDWDGMAVMLCNNMAQMLLGAQLLRRTLSGDSLSVAEDIVYNRVIPGMGVGTCFGCLFFAFQAQFAARKTGRSDLSSQPFGIDTPGMFVFAASLVNPLFLSHSANAQLTWELACLANLFQGVLEIALSLFGPCIVRCVATGALLTALANIGFAFLLTESMQSVAAAPMIGLLPLVVLLLALLADVKVPKLPVSIVPIVVGTCIAWSSGHLTASQVSGKALGPHVPQLVPLDMGHFGDVFSHMGIILPVALAASIGTLMCQQLAASLGDEFGLRSTMLGVGLSTTLAALLGCPYGFSVWVFHRAVKQMNCGVGYNVATGIGTLMICSTGFATMLLTILPIEALTIFAIFVGLMLCADALKDLTVKHRPAYIFGLVPGVCSWCVSQAQAFARLTWPTSVPMPDFSQSALWDQDATGAMAGLYALGNGYILSSVFLSSIVIALIERAFAVAAAWCIFAAVLSSFGLVHAPSMSLPWSQSVRSLPMKFTIAYASCGLLFFLLHKAQGRGYVRKGSDQERAEQEGATGDFLDLNASTIGDLPPGENASTQSVPAHGGREMSRVTRPYAGLRHSGYSQQWSPQEAPTPRFAN